MATDPDRDRKALELRKAGATPERIAEALGYDSPADALRAISALLAASPADPVDDAHRLELERLDALQRALWPRAMEGKWLAIDRCLSIMERRARLLGLDGPREEKPEKDRIDDLAERRAERRAKTADMPRP